MRSRKRWAGILALAGLSIVIFLGAVLIKAALFSPEAIHAELWSITPHGSSVEEVRAAIREKLGPKAGACWQTDREGNACEISLRYAGYYRMPVEERRSRQSVSYSASSSNLGSAFT